MKKILLAVLSVLIVLTSLTLSISASFGGYGIDVIANNTNLIKTGLVGQKIDFSDTDFKTAIGIADFGKIAIADAPKEADGTLMLGGRKISAGQEIRRKNISALSFIPASVEVKESSFTFTVEGYAGGAEISCVMKFIDKVNYAPEIKTDAKDTISVTTQKDISIFGNMSATDPEGDELEYIVISYPERGRLTVENKNNGDFRYTPTADFVGKDTFTYVARDEYGNYSTPTEVTVKVIERMSEVVYDDMEDSRAYNASVALTAMGIMSGNRLGDGMYFNPEGTVSRAEFVAMAMKATGTGANAYAEKTFFDDNDQIPEPLMKYVATAQKMGIVNGHFSSEGLVFRPNDAITKCEAAIIMANILGKNDISAMQSVDDAGYIPIYAKGQYGAMVSLGIFDDTSDASQALCREDVAEYLYRLASYKGNTQL